MTETSIDLAGPTTSPPEAAIAPPGRDMSRTILKNSVLATFGSFAMKGFNFLFTVFSVRLLGEQAFGQYSTVLAFVSLFGVFFELGLNQYVQRAIARDRAAARTLFWNLVVLRLIMAVFGTMVIVLLARAMHYDDEIVLGVLLFTSTFALAALLMPLTTVLTANERFDLATAAQVLGQLVNLGAGVAFLLLGYGFIGLLYTGFVVMPVQILLTVWAIKRFRLAELPFHVRPSTWVDFVRSSLPFGLTSLALTYNLNADTVILGFFHTQADVGWYQAAYKLVFNITGVLGGFLVVITPSLAREYRHDPERVHAWSRAVVQWMALFALPITIGISILAPLIVSLLYGAAFAPSTPALAVICWDVPLVMFNAFCGNLTAATGLERPAARIYLFSTILNIVLNLLLIPDFGFMAAAVNTVLTDGLTSVRFAILLHNQIEIGRIAPRVSRIVVSTLAMGAIVWMVRDNGLPVAIVAGTVVYGLLAVVLRLGDWAALKGPARQAVSRLIPAVTALVGGRS